MLYRQQTTSTLVLIADNGDTSLAISLSARRLENVALDHFCHREYRLSAESMEHPVKRASRCFAMSCRVDA